MEANSSTLTLAGCFHHVRSIEDKVPLIRDMIKWYCLERTRTAFDRFKSGLQTLGVLATIQSYPESFRDCLMFTNIKLTAISMEDIFRPCVSPTGSNRRTVEDRLVGYWRDFLQDAEEGATVVTLEHLLIFATGTNRVPPLGLSPSPVLSFLHEEEGGGKFPIANTCGNELKIPIHPSFEMFKENMEFGILNAPNFGRA
ncbi:G2/M phase-specific E3 ubiquitin-protein ligase-like [Saccostrea cucullata]